MNMRLKPQYGGPAMHKMAKKNPDAVLLAVMNENPDSPQEDVLAEWWKRIRKDEELLYACAMAHGVNAMRNIGLLRIDPQERAEVVRPQRSAAERAERKTEALKEAAVMAETTRQVILLDMVMPNGNPLRDCTDKDCAKAGGWLSKVAAKLKPGEKVGDVLSETEVRRLLGK
jgi:hypothetical protein